MNPPPSSSGENVTRRLLTAAEYFLRTRNFKECRDYTIRARDSDSTRRPEPDRILSIVSVLSVPNVALDLPDYYAILDLPRYESNPQHIWSNFKTLDSHLNPNSNTYSFAGEAHALVMKAWGVLSSPTEKAAYDTKLRVDAEGCNPTFWTICPYCYFVYEYDRGFEDCCLRCSNEKCRRVLHAVEISGPPPPPAVVDEGRYHCPGFAQFGSSANESGNGKGLWSPFGAKVGDRGESMKRSRKGMDVDMNRANSAPGVGLEGERRNDGAAEVEFYEGDGDVMVGLQSMF